MTKPLGSPTSQDQQDSHRTFYGHPIVVRVKDLTWEPPVEEAAAEPETWVSNLLGEDPPETGAEESLLANIAPAPEMPAYQAPVAELPPQPLAQADSKPQPASTMPGYLKHGNEGRRERLQSLITGQWKNRIMMGGMAISLFVATYWLLSGEGADSSPVGDPQQDLIVNNGSLGDAPAWPGPEVASDSQTTTIEPASRNISQMASVPPRENVMGTPAQTSSQMELTSISTPDFDTAEPANYINGNPAWEQNPASPASTPQDDYSPSFGPANLGNPAPSQPSSSLESDSGPQVPLVPNFDNAPSYGGQDSYQPSFQGNRPSYEEAAPSYEGPAMPASSSQYSDPNLGSNGSLHWMKEGKQNSMPSGNTPDNSQVRLPNIINGPQQGAGMPQIESTQPYNASRFASSPESSQPAPQDGYGYSFNHAGSLPQSPASPQDSIRAARLSGEVDTRFESGIR